MTEKISKPESTLRKRAVSVLKIILPFIILLVGVGPVLYYIISASKYFMTSDSVDSLYWAKASFDSGKLISDNFNYAAILPLGGNLLFYPFIAIFGFGIKAQIAGLTVFAVILAAAMYYMATGIGLDRYEAAGLVSVTFLLMSSSAKLREIMWEHVFYYNLGILFFCIGIGLVSRILKHGPNEKLDLSSKEGKSKLIGALIFGAATVAAIALALVGTRSVALFYIAIGVITVAAGVYMLTALILKKDLKRSAQMLRIGALALFSVLAATDGLQTLVCFSLPVFAGVFLERFFDTETPIISKKNICSLLVVSIIGIGSAIGFLLIGAISGGVTAGYADAYSSYSATYTWVNNFLGFFTNWFSLSGTVTAGGEALVSEESIYNIIRIVGAIVILIIPVIMLFFYKKLRSQAVKITLFAHFGVSAFILFAVTFGQLGGADWRLTPMLATAVITAFVGAIELIKIKKGIAMRLGVCLLCLLLVLSALSAVTIKQIGEDPNENIAWHIAADKLEERGLKYGYANFWFSGVITMLSDGNVDVASIRENESQPIAYGYQSSYDAFEDKVDAESYFLLLTEQELTNMKKWINTQFLEGDIIDNFVIETPGYDERGHVGERLYVFVFEKNIF